MATRIQYATADEMAAKLSVGLAEGGRYYLELEELFQHVCADAMLDIGVQMGNDGELDETATDTFSGRQGSVLGQIAAELVEACFQSATEWLATQAATVPA